MEIFVDHFSQDIVPEPLSLDYGYAENEMLNGSSLTFEAKGSHLLPSSTLTSTTVLPILKPGKQRKKVESYCDITLTSVPYKIFEKIIAG